VLHVVLVVRGGRRANHKGRGHCEICHRMYDRYLYCSQPCSSIFLSN
jgi:hypothetical protein